MSSGGDGTTDNGAELISGLRGLVAEEMFLLGQEADDVLGGKRQHRLTQLGEILNEADRILSHRHRDR